MAFRVLAFRVVPFRVAKVAIPEPLNVVAFTVAAVAVPVTERDPIPAAVVTVRVPTRALLGV